MTPKITANRIPSCSAPWAYFPASFWSPRPREWATFTWPPILARLLTPWENQVNMAAEPTAETAPAPTRPIQAMSVIL